MMRDYNAILVFTMYTRNLWKVRSYRLFCAYRGLRSSDNALFIKNTVFNIPSFVKFPEIRETRETIIGQFIK